MALKTSLLVVSEEKKTRVLFTDESAWYANIIEKEWP